MREERSCGREDEGESGVRGELKRYSRVGRRGEQRVGMVDGGWRTEWREEGV